MADLWITELPALAWHHDPEPDDEDDGPWCQHRDLWGQGLDAHQLHTMTTVETTGRYL